MRLMLEVERTRSGWEAIFAAYQSNDLEAVLVRALRSYEAAPRPDRVAELPSLAFRSPLPPSGFVPPEPPDLLRQLRGVIVPIEFKDSERAQAFIDRVRASGGRVGADPPIASLDVAWNPFGDMPPIFHTRDAAEALIRAQALRARGLGGEGVNLVFFDEGISRAALAARLAQLPHKGPTPLNFPNGWDVMPKGAPERRAGLAKPNSHGTIVALNALSLAPAVRVFDLPVLPDRVSNTTTFASFAAAALIWASLDIGVWLKDAYPGPWVFCHAWGVYDRRLEIPRGAFTANRTNPFNRMVELLDEEFCHDQIFAAGNGGQFCPNPQCGPGDIGPGNSILGANSSPHVLTAGAVRADGMWIGYSSQGPGQPQFATSGMVEKPDICAPSHFVEPLDAAWVSSGTSTSCGIAAGAVAALRGAGSPLAHLSPADLRQHLRDTAWKPPGHPPGYDIRLGHGILNLADALSSEAQSAM